MDPNEDDEIFFEVSWNDDSVFPDYVKYDSIANIISINPPSNSEVTSS